MAGPTAVRVGIIGTGGIAQYLHLKQYLECEDAQVVALCDVREDALAATRHRWGLQDATIFTDVGAMLAEADLDAVSICTPNDSHRDLALAAITAGVAVLCEKPLAMNARQAQEMVQAAEAANVVNMTGFSKRFFPIEGLHRRNEGNAQRRGAIRDGLGRLELCPKRKDGPLCLLTDGPQKPTISPAHHLSGRW
jgi:hypothetical protein